MEQMSSLTRSLQKRIQELKSSIESQKAELAAYERVLEIELATSGHAQQLEMTEIADTAQGTATAMKRQSPTNETAAGETGITRESETDRGPEFTGNKTGFVVAIVKARGPSGATPKEVADIFAARGVSRSKNLIYNALSLLVKQKKLQKNGGRYFSGSSDSSQKVATPRKWKISAKGLQRIREANKRRWAKKKGAQAAQASKPPQKSLAGKKSARAAGKKFPTNRAAKTTAA
jgi:hypothetical protein